MINAFLLIGQSNMAGRGSLREVAPIENSEIYMFRERKWVNAKEPLHTDKPALAGIGLGMSFADELQRKFDKQIGLIPCAFGGTSLGEWKKDGRLYSSAISETIEALKNSSLKGILWHQGESDADKLVTAQNYKQRFIPFIDSLLGDLGISTIPVVIGELGDFLDKHDDCSYWDVVNNHLKDISKEKKYFFFASAKGLTDNGDFLHFNSASLREFGHRYAAAWQECSRILGVTLE